MFCCEHTNELLRLFRDSTANVVSMLQKFVWGATNGVLHDKCVELYLGDLHRGMGICCGQCGFDAYYFFVTSIYGVNPPRDKILQ